MEAKLEELLRKYSFNFSTEKEWQSSIERMLLIDCIEFQREVKIGEGSVIDFLVGRVGIEMKIKGKPIPVINQLKRYLETGSLDYIILLTTSRRLFLAMPREHQGKAIRVVYKSLL